MTQAEIMVFLENYGLYFMFIVVFMEYLNLPGFPAGVILPAVGIWAESTGVSFILTLFVSVLAGLLGSLILYYIGKLGGVPLLEKIKLKYPKTSIKIRDLEEKMIKNANLTVFIAKLIPVVRTLVGFPAGVVKMNIINYLLYSSLGIAIWNFIFMIFGSLLSEFIF